MSRLKSRVFWKLLATYAVLSLIALAGLLVAVDQKLQNETHREVAGNFRQRVSNLAKLVERDAANAESLRSLSVILERSEYAALCSLDAEVLSSVAASEYSVSDSSIAFRRRLIAASETDSVAILWDPVHSDRIHGVAVTSETDGIPGPFLVLSANVHSQLATYSLFRISSIRTALIGWICCTACLATALFYFVNPLHMLLKAVREPDDSIHRRDTLLRLQEHQDEFGELSAQLLKPTRAARESTSQQEHAWGQTGVRPVELLQAMVEGVIAVDQRERILFANDAACAMLAMSSGKVIGRPVFEAVRNNHLHEVIRDTIAESRPGSIEFRLSRNNVSLSVVASPTPEGGAVLVLDDVTEMRQLESTRRDFVSGVSHELKTPLTVIQACTETLLEGAVDDGDTARRFLRQIEEQSERLLQLIIGMLQLARMESGDEAFDSEPVDLAEAGRQIVKAMSPVAAGKDITLSLTGCAELFVLADYQAIRTIVGNLVDNALKYTPRGGNVQIELREDSDAAVMRVIDDGVGIPEKEQKRVFERFYRIERDRNRERGGTGLGLSIVKHLTQAMNAEIFMDSSVGQGCAITVKFPFRD